MKHSDALDTLAEALAKAQGQMEGALKASTNPFFKSKYADLKSVWEACRKPLSDNALSVVQTVRCEWAGGAGKDVAALAAAVNERTQPPAVIVTTLLMHASGQWIEEELAMWPRENSPQAIGTCASYARRYALAGMVGVYQEDDDANRASGHEEKIADSLNDYFTDLVTAIKDNNVELARKRWNELNTLGSTAEVWRVLNTKQKAAMRALLQQTQAAPAQREPGEDDEVEEGARQ